MYLGLYGERHINFMEDTLAKLQWKYNHIAFLLSIIIKQLRLYKTQICSLNNDMQNTRISRSVTNYSWMKHID